MDQSEKILSTPKVAAAIVTCNRKESILRLLSFLESRDIPAFVLDNASIDGAEEAIISRFNEVSVLKSDVYLGFSPSQCHRH